MSFRLSRYQTVYRHSEEEGGNLQKSFQGQSHVKCKNIKWEGGGDTLQTATPMYRKGAEIRKHLEQIIKNGWLPYKKIRSTVEISYDKSHLSSFLTLFT